MSDLSILGLGSMGATIASVLLKAGFSVSVWNRSMDKAKPFEKIGAIAASSVERAIEESRCTIVCIDGYQSATTLLNQPQVLEELSGHIIIQLSTGTPKEAADFGRWVNENGGDYLDGAIMVYPETLGSEEAQILVGGPENVFDQCRDFLNALGGDLRYLGNNVKAAAALDLALLSRLASNNCGVMHGAHICESEGVSVDLYASLFAESDRAHTLAKAIADDENTVQRIGASVNLFSSVLNLLQSQASAVGINSEVPDLFQSLAERAIAAGYGEEGTTAIIKILRNDSSSAK